MSNTINKKCETCYMYKTSSHDIGCEGCNVNCDHCPMKIIEGEA